MIGLQAVSAEEREVEKGLIKVPQGFQLPRVCHSKKKRCLILVDFRVLERVVFFANPPYLPPPSILIAKEE